MEKRDPKKYTFEFEEQGTNEVSEQIMNSYNSGFIDQDFGETRNQEFSGSES